MKHSLRLLLPLAVCAIAWTAAPNARQAQTPPEPRMINQSTDPLLAPFRFRSIGPASMGGRIDDIAVSDTDPNIIYARLRGGRGVQVREQRHHLAAGVRRPTPTASIGDIAIHPANPNIVYVGTGEANNRQTSSFGDGIYKTTDGGKTFQNVGLKDTQTIARIVIDPRNPETVYVAVPGHLFGPNQERGVYKTTDGGRTLEQRQVHRRGHRLHRHRDRSGEQPTSCMRPAISGAGWDAASTAAVLAARCGRRPTAASRGRS